MNVGSVFNAALLRAFLIGVLQALIEIGTALGTDAPDRVIVAAGLKAFGVAMLARMVEGTFDMNRARNGTVLDSDIGSTTTTVRTSVPIAEAPIRIFQPPVPPAG